MTFKSWRWRAGLSALAALLAVGACSSSDMPSPILGSAGGASQAGHAGASAAGTGASGAGAKGGGSGSSEAGALGEGGALPGPVAVFQSELEVDVGCNGVTPDGNLLIRNAG